MPAGKATIRFEFAYDGGGLGKGGLGTIYVNDKKVAEGRIESTQPMIFSADETADVGVDDAMPVTEDYKLGDNEFTGKIHQVTIDIGAIGAGHEGRGGQGRRRVCGKAGRGPRTETDSAVDVTSRRAFPATLGGCPPPHAEASSPGPGARMPSFFMRL